MNCKNKRLRHYTILLLLLLFAILPSKKIFTQKTDIEKYAKSYSRSQYVLGEASPQKIDDDTLYVYAGYAYMKGEDPTTINFEHPPFGKYLIGLSYKLFANSFLINIPVFFLVLYLMYEIQKKLNIAESIRYLPLVLLSSSNLFIDHMGRGLMDLQQLMFTLLFFNILLGVQKNKSIFLGLVMGIIASIKYPFPLMGVFVLVLIMDSFINKQLKKGVLSVSIAAIVYLLTYIAYFAHAHTLIDYAKFEWYRFKWWTGYRIIPRFLLLKTIFFGTFKGWWDDTSYEVAKNFTHFWKVLFALNIFSIPHSIKINSKNLYLIIYSSVLLLLYLFGSAANERYLIQLIPFWMINIAMIASHLNIYLNRKIRN